MGFLPCGIHCAHPNNTSAVCRTLGQNNCTTRRFSGVHMPTAKKQSTRLTANISGQWPTRPEVPFCHCSPPPPPPSRESTAPVPLVPLTTALVVRAAGGHGWWPLGCGCTSRQATPPPRPPKHKTGAESGRRGSHGQPQRPIPQPQSIDTPSMAWTAKSHSAQRLMLVGPRSVFLFFGRGDALKRKGPEKRSDRRLEEVVKAVGGGYCRL